MLQVHRFYLNNALQNYNYMITDTESSDCVAIDPTNADQSLEFCMLKQLQPTAIWLTHQDQDHIGGAEELSQYFDIPIVCSEFLTPHFSNTVTVTHNSIALIGQYEFTVMATPGHCHDHLCFVESANKSLLF